MARSDKDNGAKQQALRFCAISGAVPYLEVLVPSAIDLTAEEKVLTDIDVVGVQVGGDGAVSRIVFDCKSSKIAPMSRAFWLAGLMKYAQAHEGFVILGKNAERAHRLSAQAINVKLFDLESFRTYSVATNPEFDLIKAYSANLEGWHRFTESVAATGRHDGLLRYLISEIPLATDPTKRFRRLLSVIKEHRGELDPLKPLHMALFSEAVLGACILLAPMIGELRNIVHLKETKEEYETVLRYYLWGGRDGFTMLQKMNEARGNTGGLSDFENSLVAWPQFMEMTRGLLEAPTHLKDCCMPLRELTLKFVSDADEECDDRLGKLLSQTRVRQFSNRIANYLTVAAKLPSEFPNNLNSIMTSLIEKAGTERGHSQLNYSPSKTVQS